MIRGLAMVPCDGFMLATRCRSREIRQVHEDT